MHKISFGAGVLATVWAALLGTCCGTGLANAAQIDIAGGAPGTPVAVAFGSRITVLPNGNIVIVDVLANGPNATSQAGAVFLYAPNGTLISVLTGSANNDFVGNGGVFLVGGGNFVVASPDWNGASGAATWVNGTTGLNGTVSASNSLVGQPLSRVSNDGVTVLSNGNYVISSHFWGIDGSGNGRGAVTWADATVGVAGAVSASNSAVGSRSNDQVGFAGVIALTNGNYVFGSPLWNNLEGAATWANGSTGLKGTVSALNSLVGVQTNDLVGYHLTALSNGNYVVGSPYFANNSMASSGAATWGDGTHSIADEVSDANSLVGTAANDAVGSSVVALSNGNYLVVSNNGGAGAVSWESGTTGQPSGAVSASNSLVGTLGSNVTKLTNGNYVVCTASWNGVGAATWGDGTHGIVGGISSGNSLVGSSSGDYVCLNGVVALSNGNYVVSSPNWNGGTGAASWANGSTGLTGIVSAANSLLGATAGDNAGSVVTALSNGNYVVGSPGFGTQQSPSSPPRKTGAATWANGLSGLIGVVSPGNSLVGSANDSVGYGIVALKNGNYVVQSPSWNSGTGAATWANGASGLIGVVSPSNSLVGASAGDSVGTGVLALSNGNYVVQSPTWSGVGAATWANGAIGSKGEVSSLNSLVGTYANDRVGETDYNGAGIALSDGNYVVYTPAWNGGHGAMTLTSGAARMSGAIEAWNSVLGNAANGGGNMVFAYDTTHKRLVVGRPADQIVSVFTMERIFADGFE